VTTLSIPPPETVYLNGSVSSYTPEPSTVTFTTAFETTLILTETKTADQATFTLNLTRTQVSSYFETYTTYLDGSTILDVRTFTLDQATFTLPPETKTLRPSDSYTQFDPDASQHLFRDIHDISRRIYHSRD
jgi:hypothetical protein